LSCPTGKAGTISPPEAKAVPVAPLIPCLNLHAPLPRRYYGLAKSFATPLDVGDKPFVLQYEVKLDEPLTCGGAYLKVFQVRGGLLGLILRGLRMKCSTT
jgi:hypothetical protein